MILNDDFYNNNALNYDNLLTCLPILDYHRGCFLSREIRIFWQKFYIGGYFGCMCLHNKGLGIADIAIFIRFFEIFVDKVTFAVLLGQISSVCVFFNRKSRVYNAFIDANIHCAEAFREQRDKS